VITAPFIEIARGRVPGGDFRVAEMNRCRTPTACSTP
jgi:hypothetical protein